MPVFAQGDNPPMADAPSFDLTYISQLLQALILATLPVLAGMGAKLLFAKIEAEKQKLSDEKLWALGIFIKTVVYAAEQINVKDRVVSKLDYATALVDTWLSDHKIELDPFEIRARIEAAVKQEFNTKKLPAPEG